MNKEQEKKVELLESYLEMSDGMKAFFSGGRPVAEFDEAVKEKIEEIKKDQ